MWRSNQCGDQIYESKVRPEVEAGNYGRTVAIDIETESYEIADKVVTASEQLLSKLPDAQTWFVRVGHQAVYHFGSL